MVTDFIVFKPWLWIIIFENPCVSCSLWKSWLSKGSPPCTILSCHRPVCLSSAAFCFVRHWEGEEPNWAESYRPDEQLQMIALSHLSKFNFFRQWQRWWVFSFPSSSLRACILTVQVWVLYRRLVPWQLHTGSMIHMTWPWQWGAVLLP